MAVLRYLVTAGAGPKTDMWASTGAFANWITVRDNPRGDETWLVTVYAENSAAFLNAARETGVTVEEIDGADDTEQYLLRVGEPGTGYQTADTHRGARPVADRSELHVTPYLCPIPGCVGGLIADSEGTVDRCLHCAGSGLTDDPMDGADRAPRPPAVMRTPCADCAFRPGSPELDEARVQLPEDEPFFCHQGLPVSADGRYQPVAMFRGLPLGAMVCAGWWAARTGEQLPEQPYREVPLGEQGVDQRWGEPARRNIARALAQCHRPDQEA